jgi:hypothetical protein
MKKNIFRHHFRNTRPISEIICFYNMVRSGRGLLHKVKFNGITVEFSSDFVKRSMRNVTNSIESVCVSPVELNETIYVDIKNKIKQGKIK